MQSRFSHHLKNLLLPCLAFSAAAGVLSALLITLFKIAAEHTSRLSERIYHAVGETPALLPLLLLGAALAGLFLCLLLSRSHSCKGGGIPTSVAAVCGTVPFKWLKSILILPFCALLTYLCGIPLGTEGPCVQMGTAVGDSVVRRFGKHRGWRRYIMTGGASAGFAVATAAPITAVIFSMEELHKHFSPLLLTTASISVATAQCTSRLLDLIGLGEAALFSVDNIPALGMHRFFAPLLVGLVCGLCAILFTRLYHVVDRAMRAILKRISPLLLFPLLFASICAVGFFLADTRGSGHGLTERLFETPMLPWLLLLVFLLRALMLTLANTAGVTGGIFLPMLAFGAILGALCADGMIALGWIGAEERILLVVLGIASFLGASSRIPVTASVFAIEALGGIHNVLPIVIATTVALLTVELAGVEDFTDTVIRAKIRSVSKGRSPTVITAPLTVAAGAFAVGKELRDILWPASCRIIAYEHKSTEGGGIAVGDVITVRYETYHPEDTAAEFKALVGEQSTHTDGVMLPHPKIADEA